MSEIRVAHLYLLGSSIHPFLLLMGSAPVSFACIKCRVEEIPPGQVLDGPLLFLDT